MRLQSGLRTLLGASLLCAFAAHAAAPAGGDYYNDGNAHARAGEWGLAMLDYERARLLRPDDPDLDANWHYVIGAAKLRAPPPTYGERIARLTRPDVAAAVGLLGLLALGGALLWRNSGLRFAALLLGTPLVGFAVCHAIALRPLVHGAVVIRGPAPVRASPVPMADELYSLPEAEAVRIDATRPDYLLITDARGKAGWVSRSQVEPIVPSP